MGIGNELMESVLKRTGLKASELVCPRERSDMTPCVARDGDCAMTNDCHCVGCGVSVLGLFETEKQKQLYAGE